MRRDLFIVFVRCAIASPCVAPPGNPWTRRGNGTVLVLIFFPAGEGSFIVLGTISLDHGDVPTGFV